MLRAALPAKTTHFVFAPLAARQKALYQRVIELHRQGAGEAE